MAVICPGAVIVTESARWSQTYGYRELGFPPVCILHTVEGVMSRAGIAAHRWPPHLWLDPITGELFQTISLDRPALALENPPGEPRETNHRGVCLQIELQLYSDPRRKGTVRHVESLTDDQLGGIGQLLATLDEICVETLDPQGRGFLPRSPDEVTELPTGDAGYGSGTEWRMSPTEWFEVGGVRGHAEVPQNAHYDPDGLNMRRIVAHALNLSPIIVAPTPPPLLSIGFSGDAAARWQQLLNEVIDAKLVVDGRFGPVTAEATRDLERAIGLAPDGVVSVEQWRLAIGVRAQQQAGDRPRPLPGASPTTSLPVETSPEVDTFILDQAERSALKTVALLREARSER